MVELTGAGSRPRSATRDSTATQTYPVLDPATGLGIGEIAECTPAEDAPEAAGAERFIIRWHDFTVFQAAN